MIDPPVFVVDWDGTLVDDHHYPEQGEWLPGAVDALRELLNHGEVLIYTLRVNPYERDHDGDERYRRTQADILIQLASIYGMLDKEGLHEVKVHMTLGKPAGTYYIDNQAIEFKGDWGEVLSRVLGEREGPSATGGVGPDRPPTSAQGSGSRSPSIRQFPTGATRDTAEGKLAYEGFFSPLVLQERARFMHKHRIQSDGNLRPGDNWQKGIPLDAYMDSGFRHFMSWWLNHRGQEGGESLTEALCALMFNCEGYLHTLLTDATSELA